MPEQDWRIRSVETDAECRRAVRAVMRRSRPDQIPACFDEYVSERGEGSKRELLDLSQTLVAEVESGFAATVPVLVQPDGTMAFWKANVDHNIIAADVAVLMKHELYSAVAAQFDASRCWIAQLLLNAGDGNESTLLSECGFARLAGLVLLELPLDPSHQTSAGKDAVDQSSGCGNMTRTPFTSEESDRFATVIERTCEGTLDCPELNDHRSGVQALESHRLSGRHGSDLWSIFSVDGVDCGILLMSEPEETVREVVYFGVTPEFRRQGFGRAILAWGIQQTESAGGEAVVLAVDERNLPARELYDSLGFEEVEGRIVHARLKPTGTAQTSSGIG